MDDSKKFTPLTIGKKYPRRISNWAFLFQYKAIENAYLTPYTWRAWLKETDQTMRSQYSRIVIAGGQMRCRRRRHDADQHATQHLAYHTAHGPGHHLHYRSLVQHHFVELASGGHCDNTAWAAKAVGKLMPLDSLHLERLEWYRITRTTIVSDYRHSSFVMEANGAEVKTSAKICSCPWGSRKMCLIGTWPLRPTYRRLAPPCRVCTLCAPISRLQAASRTSV